MRLSIARWARLHMSCFEARRKVDLRLRCVGDGLGNLLEIGDAPLRTISH